MASVCMLHRQRKHFGLFVECDLGEFGQWLAFVPQTQGSGVTAGQLGSLIDVAVP